MKSDIGLTGERLIEDSYRGSIGGYVIYLLHEASYRFAVDYCKGGHVLDLGCGTGYGASFLAEYAGKIVAADVSVEAIDYAASKYKRNNVEFHVIRPDSELPFVDSSFDVVLSFQVLEHVKSDAFYLAEAARVLKKGGIMIIVTPDRAHRLLPGQRPWNRWHLREYSAKQLTRVAGERFDILNLLKMGARSDVAAIELRRYRFLKWITLLFTFPCAPETWRRAGLDFIHRVKPQRHDSSVSFSPDFGVETISIAPRVDKSLNLVMVAQRR